MQQKKKGYLHSEKICPFTKTEDTFQNSKLGTFQVLHTNGSMAIPYVGAVIDIYGAIEARNI